MKDILYSLRRLHGRIHEWRMNVLPLYWERIRNPRAVYLVLTPEHKNLGDHAIAQSEIQLLKELAIPYIEYSEQRLQRLADKNAFGVLNGRVILATGGGNMGTLWYYHEEMVRKIILKNPNSKIFLLPNTIVYEDTEWGKKEFQRSIEIYNTHKYLKLYAREKTSFDLMKQVYNDVSLVPDMVLSMNHCREGTCRDGCIICLRMDKERTRSDAQNQEIEQQMVALFGDKVQRLDMIKDYMIPIKERDRELEWQYDAFRHAELVVTDRLHGMIFAAITGTPCIVLDSKSPKMRGCFEWIKDLEYIRFCDDVTQISTIYQAIPNKEWEYDSTKLLPLFSSLKEDILKAVKR